MKARKHKHHKKEDTRPSEKQPIIAEKLSRMLNMKEDILLGAPIVMGYGKHRFCIENYRSIIEYTQQLIRVQTKSCRIHIYGNNLSIAYYREDTMCILGDIERIEYH